MMLYKKETISDDGRIKVEKITTSEDYLVHKHEFIELVYIMAGGGSQIINGSSRAVIQTARCFTSTLRRYTGSLPEVSGGKSRNSLREAVDLEFYTHDLSAGALPNDDLDLQLSWLCAAERYHCTQLGRVRCGQDQSASGTGAPSSRRILQCVQGFQRSMDSQ